MTVVGAMASVAPSGRSRTARRCWANWLVTDPSWVQCPELWGRIASSLTYRRVGSPKVSTAKSSTASTPVTPARSATVRPMSSASSTAVESRPGAGARTSAHMPSSWTVWATGHTSTCPLGVRASRTASSRVKGIACSTRRLVTTAPPRLPPPPAPRPSP